MINWFPPTKQLYFVMSHEKSLPPKFFSEKSRKKHFISIGWNSSFDGIKRQRGISQDDENSHQEIILKTTIKIITVTILSIFFGLNDLLRLINVQNTGHRKRPTFLTQKIKIFNFLILGSFLRKNFTQKDSHRLEFPLLR